ncbi:hypothetical protein I4U23_006192 [Adineta vaga]|nr:hypothetical protein I4U23_006192 [Adineta vaga]
MHKSDCENGSIDYIRSKHRNTFLENDFKVHLTQSEQFFQNIINDEQLETDEEEGEGFTDLRACEEPLDSDSGSYRSNSPVVIDNDQPKNIPSSTFSLENQSETISTDSLKSSYLKSYDDLLYLLHQDPYKFIFTAIPKEMTKYLQCRMIREKSLLSEIFYFQIEFENNEEPITLLTAEKVRKTLGQSQYLISLDSSFDCNSCSAELIAKNMTGTEYMLYKYNDNDDQREVLAVILYESNFLGLKGPRRTNVLLPKVDPEMQPLFKDDEIQEFSSEEPDDSFVHLYNTAPVWSSENGSYVIRFDGINRITIPSVKNFQLFILDNNNDEHKVMEFGRMSDKIFSCDFRYPLSFVQAFSIGLTAFETRLFRE